MRTTRSLTAGSMVALGLTAVLAVTAPATAEESWQSPLLIPAAEFENNGVYPAELVDIGDCPSVPDVEVELRSVSFSTGASTLHASVISNDNMTMEVFADSSIADPVVNTLDRAYFVVVYMCGQFQAMQAVRVHFLE